jgi:nucleoside-diphosphate-sugar epimerase
MPYDADAGPLILGASGKIGSAINTLHTAGMFDFAAQPTWQYRQSSTGLNWDILHEKQSKVAFCGIIVLAGVTAGENLELNTALAQAACDLADGARVLIASTQAVYGSQAGLLSEQTLCRPNTADGRAKFAMEQAMARHTNVTCLRIGNVLGSDALTAAMTAGEVTLDIFPDGRSPCRAMIGPLTLARSLAQLIQTPKPLPQTLNLAQPKLVEMAAILTAAGRFWVPRPAPPTALARLELDLRKVADFVDLPDTDPHQLLCEAKLAGWNL